jgi:hypothetical protein
MGNEASEPANRKPRKTRQQTRKASNIGCVLADSFTMMVVAGSVSLARRESFVNLI